MNLAMRKAARDVCLLRDPDQAKENLPNRFSPGNARTKMIMVREGGLEPPRLAAPDPKADTTHRPMFSQVSPCRKHEAFSFSTPRQITSHQLRVGTEWALQGIED